MRICVESRYQHAQTNLNQYEDLTEVTLTYWPDDKLKNVWDIAGYMLSSFVDYHSFPSGNETNRHLTMRHTIWHNRLKKGEKIEKVVDSTEKDMRLNLSAAIKKVNRYITSHNSVVSRVILLQSRFDKLEKMFNRHASIKGSRPHGK